MNLQALLASLAKNIRRPGFIKSMAGQLAVAYGSQLAMEAATEADERFQLANDALDELQVKLAASRSELGDRILSGELDAYVVERYDQLAKAKAAEFERERLATEDDPGWPVETMGAAVDLPGEAIPPCALSVDCVLDYGHDALTACRPAVPPTMAGGYLRSVKGVGADPADDDAAAG
jgi:hypothetical protein